MIPVVASVAYEARMKMIILQWAEDSLRGAHPKARVLDKKLSIAVPEYPTDTCPEGWAMAGVLLTFQDDE